jgi:hypothetical protein
MSRPVSKEVDATVTMVLAFQSHGVGRTEILYRVKTSEKAWGPWRAVTPDVRDLLARQEFQVEVVAEAEGTYVPGAPEIGPRYDHGGIPADPPEIEDLSIEWEGDIITDGLRENEIETIINELIDEAEEPGDEEE